MKPAKICFSLLVLGTFIFLFLPNPAQAQWNFIRGDKNIDGVVDTSDYKLFFSSDPGPCFDANDVDDNGLLEPADANYLENYLFHGGPPPLAPFPACGPDPTPDALSCGYTSCAVKTFVRGDADCDGFINSQDSTFLENFLIGGTAPACLDAADVDDDGAISNADVIYLSNYLNSGGPPPALPFPAPCVDPTFDTLTCDSSCATQECSDGIDNDGDGLADFFDCGCSEGCQDSEAPNPSTECSDGIDNDGDGLVDLADTNCINICDDEELSITCTHKPCDADIYGREDGRWTLSDIINFVGMVYKGASKPTPLCRADCNASGGNPNLTDIIYLVNKVFKGGPNPVIAGECCIP